MNEMKYKKESDEVLYTSSSVTQISKKDIEDLKVLAKLNERQRIRICTHPKPDSNLHEMLIVHTKNCYVRPHKHPIKVESLSVIEGSARMIIFNDDGEVQDSFIMSDYSSGHRFYNRIESPLYHMLIIESDFFVFHEVTEGPFLKNSSVFPDWAPEYYDNKFINDILKK